MIQQLETSPLTIRLDTERPVSAYVLETADGAVVGRADFVDDPSEERSRIFFHTEVDEAYVGQGLAGRLVRHALAESIVLGLTVVPVCPLFARYLKTRGDEFLAAGGLYRKPTSADLALAKRALTAGAAPGAVDAT